MKTIVSPKLNLIIEDIKSWSITTALMFGPLVLVSFIELLMKQDFGSYTQVALLVLGSLLKLAQKWVKMSNY